MPSDAELILNRAAVLVALTDSGEFRSKNIPPEWAGEHRNVIWSVALDGTIEAWWEDGGEFD